MQQIPFELEAEYRGRQAEGGEFVNDSGEKVSFGPAYRFEYDLPDGDVATMSLREGAVDKAADFDAAKLAKGDRVKLVGTAMISERGSDANSFVRLYTLRRIGVANGLKAA